MSKDNPKNSKINEDDLKVDNLLEEEQENEEQYEIEDEEQYEIEDEEQYEIENEEQYEIENEMTVDESAAIHEQIFGLDVRRQEIDAILEHYENVLYNSGEETLTEEELNNLKIEYKAIESDRKELLKKSTKSIWDKFPLWMAFYAVFQFIFSFYPIMLGVSIDFMSWSSKLFTSTDSEALFYVLFFSIPFLSLLVSLIIMLILKNSIYKKIFSFIFLLQGIETLVTVILMISLVV